MGKVSIQNLEKVYPATKNNPAFRAVRGIDLEINEGEFMVLVGPSGCGKSTTLRMVAGLEKITRKGGRGRPAGPRSRLRWPAERATDDRSPNGDRRPTASSRSLGRGFYSGAKTTAPIINLAS